MINTRKATDTELSTNQHLSFMFQDPPFLCTQDGDQPLAEVPPHLQNQPLMNKAVAKETIANSLPVQEGVLHAHQSVVATLTARMRQRKLQERQQVRVLGGRALFVCCVCVFAVRASHAIVFAHHIHPTWKQAASFSSPESLGTLSPPSHPRVQALATPNSCSLTMVLSLKCAPHRRALPTTSTSPSTPATSRYSRPF